MLAGLFGNYQMSRIAIILARGGSKRLPRKNILPLADIPMIGWSIVTCLSSNLFQRVLVSTDDDEIAQIALEFGAEVPFLRSHAFDDYSTSSEATLVALSQAEDYWCEQYSEVAQLMANCPFRTVEDMHNAVNAYSSSNTSSQISAFRYGWMNPWWAAKLDDNGSPEWIFPDMKNKRSQDLPPLYCPSGSMWLSSTKALKEAGTFYTMNHTFFEMSWMSALDIDNQADYELAQLVAGSIADKIVRSSID